MKALLEKVLCRPWCVALFTFLITGIGCDLYYTAHERAALKELKTEKEKELIRQGIDLEFKLEFVQRELQNSKANCQETWGLYEKVLKIAENLQKDNEKSAKMYADLFHFANECGKVLEAHKLSLPAQAFK